LKKFGPALKDIFIVEEQVGSNLSPPPPPISQHASPLTTLTHAQQQWILDALESYTLPSISTYEAFSGTPSTSSRKYTDEDPVVVPIDPRKGKTKKAT